MAPSPKIGLAMKNLGAAAPLASGVPDKKWPRQPKLTGQFDVR
jgi:hypothetical protein